MWHFKTRLGTFWVAPLAKETHKYYLGVDDHELGIYEDAERAAQDVHDQSTGYLKWDCLDRIRAPEHITEWVEGVPPEWDK